MPEERSDLSTPRFPIRIAARRGGISVAALRAWERRYSAVKPARTEGEQRLYSENDLERITLLRRLTDTGHAISAIAKASTTELRRLADTVPEKDGRPVKVASSNRHEAADGAERQRVLRACMRAVH